MQTDIYLLNELESNKSKNGLNRDIKLLQSEPISEQNVDNLLTPENKIAIKQFSFNKAPQINQKRFC